MSLLAAHPVANAHGDCNDALSRGVAEGLMCAYEATEGFRFGEHLKYSTENYGTSYSAVFVVVTE
jgi:TRAP-type C4-dicarboxylate transport system substrate-binding protein